MERQTGTSSRKKILVMGGLILALAFLPTHLLNNLNAKTNKSGIIYWHGDPSENKIALTFDDGPNEPYTSQILQILRENNVRATFFLTGKNIEVFPDSARAIVRDGHAIGNHTYTHHDCILERNATVRSEILRTADLIERTTGQRTKLFRPPYGSEDFLTRHQTMKLGYIMVQWTASAVDWRKPGPQRIVYNVLHKIGPGGIILMHDGDKWRHGSDRSQTVAALPVIIRELRNRGYQFVTVPELLKLDEYETAHNYPVTGKSAS